MDHIPTAPVLLGKKRITHYGMRKTTQFFGTHHSCRAEKGLEIPDFI